MIQTPDHSAHSLVTIPAMLYPLLRFVMCKPKFSGLAAWSMIYCSSALPGAAEFIVNYCSKCCILGQLSFKCVRVESDL